MPLPISEADMYADTAPDYWYTEDGTYCPKCNDTTGRTLDRRYRSPPFNNCPDCEAVLETTLLCTGCGNRWKEID